MTKRFLTVGRVAKELGVAPATVRKLCQQGFIPGAKRIGRWWRIPVESVEAVKRHGTEAARD
jgi:excisionase family DNA binding protein